MYGSTDMGVTIKARRIAVGLGTMSTHGAIATEMDRLRDVRFTPDSDRTADIAEGPVRATRRHSK
jgi:hypothetical protein